MEQQLNDLGVDVIKGVEIMDLLSFNKDELVIPQRFQQLREVISFLQGFNNYAFIINKVTRGKNVDKLEHIWNYINIIKEREKLKNDIEMLDKKLELPHEIEEELERQNLLDQFQLLTEEMSFFEK